MRETIVMTVAILLLFVAVLAAGFFALSQKFDDDLDVTRAEHVCYTKTHNPECFDQ
jgi:nitrogen fixation-related uncharacterized protein